MKKVFTENLSKTWKGVDWKKSIQNKLKLRFIYDDIEGEFILLDYNRPKRGYIKISYCNTEHFIHSSNLSKSKIGDIVGKINRTMKYNIGQKIKDKNRDLTIIDIKHNNSKKMYKYKCNKCGFDCGEYYNTKDKQYKDELWVLEGNLDDGKGCACCCNPTKIVVKDINSIYKTEPWMIPIIGEEISKTHTKGSHDKVQVTCSDCGKTKKQLMEINTLYLSHSIGCKCGDGFSYGHKYIFNLLTQLELMFTDNYTFNWCKFYNLYKQKEVSGEYDFVLENKRIIVEVDGDFHRRDNKMNGQTKEESKFLDDEKDRLAKKYGYKVIRISDEGDFKDNILNSDLNKLFDLTNINWLKCEEFAISNRVKEACKLKKNNPNFTTGDIGKLINVSQSSIVKWLKKGNILGWCNYLPR